MPASSSPTSWDQAHHRAAGPAFFANPAKPKQIQPGKDLQLRSTEQFDPGMDASEATWKSGGSCETRVGGVAVAAVSISIPTFFSTNET
jgi:hypothetical protein